MSRQLKVDLLLGDGIIESEQKGSLKDTRPNFFHYKCMFRDYDTIKSKPNSALTCALQSF